LTAPLGDYTRFCQTSGTKGEPISLIDTPAGWDWMLGNWQKVYDAAGVLPSDRLYFAFSFGPFLGFWTAFEAATRRGLLAIPGGGFTTSARLAAMSRAGATVLLCTPTYALHLGKARAESSESLGPTQVRVVIVAGEPGGAVPAVRERISAFWGGALVCDHYGMTEVGPVAFQPPDAPGDLEILTDSYYPELLVPDGDAPVPLGEVGELVLTPLGRIGLPLLRYRTGDLARRSPKHAADGRWVLMGGILGRCDDMVIVRGVNIYPGSLDAVLRRDPALIEYRVCVVQTGALTEIEITAEYDSENPSSHTTAAEVALYNAFSLRLPVRPAVPGSLPRPEFKARRWERVTTA
jgi:phenylacetate-CoA ligase